ncbi:MAG TPA: hypothetical protein VNQ90_02110 [Chthoniobacteraceae bacterium]|nr:hypothetical protein [Chthoniobacteraceae bacterium]
MPLPPFQAEPPVDSECLHDCAGRRHALRSRGAFTLVELLAVISLIVLLTSLSVPALRSFSHGNVTGAGYEIAGLLKNARAYALAQNRYVTVGFYYDTHDEALSVAAVCHSSPSPSADAPLLTRIHSYPGMMLKDALLSEHGSVATPVGDGDLGTFTTSRGGSDLTFSSLIRLGPDGTFEISNGSMARRVGIGLVCPVRPDEYGILEITSLTGSIDFKRAGDFANEDEVESD